MCDVGTRAERRVFVNGREWFMDDLVEYCAFRGTPILEEVDVLQPCVSPQAVLSEIELGLLRASGVTVCCFDPLAALPVQVIVGMPGANYTVDPNRQCNSDVSAVADCCVDPGEFGNSTNATRDSTLRPVIGSYNAPVQYRFQMQRFAIVENKRGRFRDEYPMKTEVPVLHASSAARHGEYTDNIQGANNETYVWTQRGTFNEAGGYVEFFNPQEGREALDSLLDRLEDATWFNSQMANFVFDMIFYNSNSKVYLHSGWIFHFTHAGTVEVNHFSHGFRSDSFETWGLNYTLRIVLLIVTLAFCVEEARKIVTVGLATHFKHWTAFLDIFSQALCLTVLLFSFALDDEGVYSSSWSLSSFQDPNQVADAFHDLEALGDLFTIYAFTVALNLLVVFCRAVMIVARLDGELALIFDTLDYAKENLISLTTMFSVILLGFVTFAFFLFGGNSEDYGTVMGSLFQTFIMLIGSPNYEALAEADAVMAPIFFFAFYILMFFVMINMFISILMNGYDQAAKVLEDRQNSKDGKKQDNLLKQIYDDFKVNWFAQGIKYTVGIWGCSRQCIKPIVASFADCCPGLPRPNLNRFKFWRRSGDGNNEQERNEGDGQDADGQDGKSTVKAEAYDFVLQLLFMLIFVIFMNLQSRGAESFENGMATSYSTRTAEWVQRNPSRIDTLEEVSVMEDVLPWAKTMLAALYSTPYCARWPRGLDVFEWQRWDRTETVLTFYSPNGSMNITYPNVTDFLTTDCDNTMDDQQLVNVVRGWNIGFLNTTFVRITIQPACYEPNYDSTSSDVMPYKRITPNTKCSETDCTSSSALEGKSCLNSVGEPIDFTNFPIGLDPPKTYNYSKPGDLGPYGLHGGIVVSLPSRVDAMWDMISRMDHDGWFSRNSASMVFDYVTYNGNLDMFSYNRVSFDLKSTGDMEKSVDMFIFPLHLSSGGGYYSSSRVASNVLFVLYVLLLIYYTGALIGDLFRKFRKQQKKGGPLYNFLIEHYSNPWHVSDTISQVISLVSLVITAMFVLDTFRATYKFSVNAAEKYEIPNNDVKAFNMLTKVDLARPLQEDWYIMYQFESLSSLYGSFLTVAALNSFFISIKVVKYVAQLSFVQVFSNTFADGMKRTFYFLCVLITLTIGWALFFSVLYGKYERNLSDIFSAMVTMVDWLLGVSFPENVLRIAPLSLIWWTLYMMIFYFIMTNMFLATMMNRYAETEGKKDIERTRAEVKSRNTILQAIYNDPEEFLDDITALAVKRNENGKDIDVIVKDLKPDGQAASKGVMKDFIIVKVNQDEDSWKREPTDSPDDGVAVKRAIVEMLKGDQETELKVDFKEAQQAKSWLSRQLSLCLRKKDDKAQASIKPTNKNCWQLNGAVTWIHTKVGNEERKNNSEKDDDVIDSSDEDDDENLEGEDRERNREEALRTNATKKSARTKCKKLLDAFLFSRAVEGRFEKDASIEDDQRVEKANEKKRLLSVFWEGSKDEQVNENDKDSISSSLRKLRVTGFEVWLDCLLTAIEKEWNEESIVTEVLRTNDMQDMAGKGGSAQAGSNKENDNFAVHASDILESLEFKAKEKYYKMLEKESQDRKQYLQQQNEVLYDYVCELEEEFKKIMGSIHNYKAKKRMMLNKLSDLLGTDTPATSGRNPSTPQVQDREHMSRLTSPWPESRGGRV